MHGLFIITYYAQTVTLLVRKAKKLKLKYHIEQNIGVQYRTCILILNIPSRNAMKIFVS